MKFSFHPSAQSELNDSIDYYEECKPGLGSEFAKEVYATKTPFNVNIGIFNAYPKDTEMEQMGNALNVWRLPSENLVRKEGLIIITTDASEGRGYHSLSARVPVMINETRRSGI